MIYKIRVGISGAVYKAGYYLATPVFRVSDLITMAGEPLLSASMNNVVIENLVGEKQTYDLIRQRCDVQHKSYRRD